MTPLGWMCARIKSLEELQKQNASRKVRFDRIAARTNQLSYFTQVKGFPDIVETEDSDAAVEKHKILLSLNRPAGTERMWVSIADP